LRFSSLFHTLAQQIGDLGDGHEGVGVNGGDDLLHAGNLEAVYHEVDDGLVLAGVKALGADVGDAPAEGLRQGFADVVGSGGDDHGRLGLIETVHDEVHGLDGGTVGENGVQGEDPAVEHAADDQIQDHVVDHHEGTHGQSQLLREDDCHDFNTVDGAAKADGHAAAGTGDQTTEQGAQQKILASKGRGGGHIYWQDIIDDKRGSGIDRHGPDGIYREHNALFFQTKQEQRNVQDQQEQR